MTNNDRPSEPTRVALLGAGYISAFHIEALRKLPDVEVCAVCDLNGARAAAVATAHGVPNHYTRLDQMLAAERLHVVHVLLPPPAHVSAINQILEAGVDVLAEKPLAVSSADCQALGAHAEQRGRTLGVGHNFLFAPNYERLVADMKAGRLGRIDQIDIVWNKELGQLKGGPFGSWLLSNPSNVLFEIGPHSLAHAVDLAGDLEKLTVEVRDRVVLPGGCPFYRRWEALGWNGNTSVRLRFAFIDGYTQHFIHVRGTSAAATVDFEQGTYVCNQHSAQMLDIDRFLAQTTAVKSQLAQASETLARFLLWKVGVVKEGAPFQRSITRAVRAFYAGRGAGPALDERLSADLAARSVNLGERMRDAAQFGADEGKSTKTIQAPGFSGEPPAASVLVVGGTGFIGRALVRKLREAGQGVRLLARNPDAVPEDLKALGLDIRKGDLIDADSVTPALDGIRTVYHLARGNGETWEDYVRTDVEPTRRFAELCLDAGVERFYYTSSIAIYYAGGAAGTVDEKTPPHEGVLRTNIYSRAKVEIEKLLLDLHRSRGLGVVIFRPGIVLGDGGNPLHWGVAGWPFSTVPRLWGDGTHELPIVLVDDCVEAMIKAQDVKGIEGESFNLVGDPCLTALQYLDELEKAAGVKFHRVATSSARYFVEDVAKYLVKTLARDPGRKLPSYANWDGRTCAARFDNTRAKTLLGWQPATEREVIVREGIVLPAEQFLS